MNPPLVQVLFEAEPFAFILPLTKNTIGYFADGWKKTSTPYFCLKMTDSNSTGLKRIKRALISVSDKTGIIDFAKQLKEFGVEIISTGGTAKTLRDARIEVRDVSDVTGFERPAGLFAFCAVGVQEGFLTSRDQRNHTACSTTKIVTS